MKENTSSYKQFAFKGSIVRSIIIAIALTVLLVLNQVPIFVLPFAFIIFFFIFCLVFFASYKLESIVSWPIIYSANKLVFEKAEIGKINKSGNIIYSWSYPAVKRDLSIILHYKIALMLFFLFFFAVFSLPFYPLLYEKGIMYFFAADFSFSFLAFTLFLIISWLNSKDRAKTIVFEVLTEGVYLNARILDQDMPGLFISYSDLASPVFDDKNKLIILKIKGKRFLRRFIICTSENYKEVCEYMKSRMTNIASQIST